MEARGAGCGGTSDGPGLIVDGGGFTDGPCVGFFGSAGGNNKQTHVVRNGGNLVVWDTWYETAVSKAESEPRYIHLTDRGSLTFFGGHIATLPGQAARRDLFSIDLDGFQGKCAIINAGMDALNPQVRLAGNGEGMNFLALGMGFAVIEPHLDNQAKQAKFCILACRQSIDNGGPKVLPTEGDSSPEFLRAMLAQARSVLPGEWQPSPKGATDLRLSRISVRYQIGEGMSYHAGGNF